MGLKFYSVSNLVIMINATLLFLYANLSLRINNENKLIYFSKDKSKEQRIQEDYLLKMFREF